jgi:hypothetical protein
MCSALQCMTAASNLHAEHDLVDLLQRCRCVVLCRACNRLGIDSTTSPLLKMTFETAAKFLTDAALTGGSDSLTSPAARLVVGAVTEVGTGCCQLLHEG